MLSLDFLSSRVRIEIFFFIFKKERCIKKTWRTEEIFRDPLLAKDTLGYTIRRYDL